MTKFTGALLAPWAVLRATSSSGLVACCVCPVWGLARQALACHASQRVWYRSLFIAFASCASFNVLRRATR